MAERFAKMKERRNDEMSKFNNNFRGSRSGGYGGRGGGVGRGGGGGYRNRY